MSRADQLAAIESGLLSPWADTAPLITATQALSDKEAEAFRADATAGAITLTLPAASAAKDAYMRRVDLTQNALVILAAGTDKLMLDTTAEATGQAQTELLFAGDWMHLRSDGAGKWWCVGQAQLPGSIASGLVAYAAPGSDTFTVPPVLRSGRRVPTITVVAGAGGGAEGPSGWRGGGGGGGGAGIKVTSLAGVMNVPVTVGAGGAGGIGVGVAGQNGAASSFGAHVSATGGGGGGDNPGGPPGGASGADATFWGGYGSDGSSSNGGSGDGGASAFGGGGRSGSGSGVGGGHPGGGGGAGTGGIGMGGNGAGGLVLIKWG